MDLWYIIDMLNSLKKKKIIIYIILLSILSVGGSFLVFGISIWTNNQKFPYYIPLLIISFIYAFLAYLIGDLRIIRYKKEVGEYNPVIPENIQEEVWDRRTPFAGALIITLLVIGIFLIIRLITGSWPFLQ